MTAIAVTIAGSDSGGGAGIQADLKTFSALGVYGASVITALTAQNTLGVSAIHGVPAPFVTAQIEAVFTDLKVDAVKIGMLADAAVIAAVADGLARRSGAPVVVDPVMVATSGDALTLGDTGDALKRHLFPLAAVVTPNLIEAARLTGMPVAASREDMLAQARAIRAMGPANVLIKGGHGDGPWCDDVLLTADEALWFRSKRHETANTHGTGCTLSSALASYLAKGQSVAAAMPLAKDYVTRAIVAGDALEIGHGHGPLHHFHEWW